MNKVKNISRYWVDNGTGLICRKWNDEENKYHDKYKHIFEKHWCYYCPICGFEPVICADKDEAEHSRHIHKNRTGHTCSVEYKDFELACLEFREEFVEEFGMWVYKQELY